MAQKKKKIPKQSFEDWSRQQHGVPDDEQSVARRKSWEKVYNAYYAEDDANIAPVVSQKEEEEEGLDFFDLPGIFDDGYQFGDLSKAISGTLGDVGLSVVQGVGNMGEGVTDLLLYGVSGLSDLVGADSFADDVKKVAQHKSVDTAFNWLRDVSDIDETSALGDTSRAVGQGLGQVGGIILTGGLGGAAGLGAAGVSALTTGTMFASSMGSGMGEAYEGGATDGEAVGYGALKGAVDAGTELLFGGLGKGVKALGLSKGISSLDDVFAKKLSSKISSQFWKTATQLGVKAAGEGTEEVLAGLGSAVAKKLTYMSDEELTKLVNDENLLEQFVVGAVTSGIAQGGDAVTSVKTGTDFITGLTANEQKVVDSVYEKAIAKAEKDGKTLTKREKAKLYDSVTESLKKGGISIEDIEEVLGGDSYKAYQEVVEKDNAAIEELKGLYEGDELKSAIDDIVKNSERHKLKETLDKDVLGLVTDSKSKYLYESYNERAKKSKGYQADLSQYDEKQQHIVQKAIDSGILNDTRGAHELVDLVAKVYKEKDIDFDFANNDKIKNSGFAVEGKTVNGYVENGKVTLNIESKNHLNFVVGHEITHVLEGTDLYNSLAETIKEYAKAKGEYDNRLREARALYKDVDGYKGADGFENIKKEVVADLVGDYIFSDTDFIRTLSTKNRNTFQKIYDEIKYLYKMATAGSKEARQLERVKKAFEEVYRSESKATENTEAKGEVAEETEETKTQTNANYSLEWADDTPYVKTDKTTFLKEDGTLASEKEVFDSLVGTVIPLADGDVKIVKNLPGKRMYKELFNRQPKYKKNVKDVKQLNSEVNYNMKELLENSEAVSLNDPDADERHKEQGITAFDTRKVNFYDGNRAYKIELSIGVLGSGEKVAYAKKYYGYDADLTKKIQAAETRGFTNTPMNQQPVSDSRIPQKGAKVKRQFSLSDSDGKQLSKEQQDYFKDSKIVDENGALKIMHHGSKESFTVFDKKKARSSGTYGNGFYFTDSDSHAKTYGKTYDVYLNITNPMQDGTNDITKEQLRAFVEAVAENEDYGIENYGYGATVDSVTDSVYGKSDFAMLMDLNISCVGNMVEAIELFNKVNGTDYNGIVTPMETVAFYPEQIKSVDNLNPTSDPDIRYSLSQDSEGREVNDAVQKRFANTKVLDESGRLKAVYHGTASGEFFIFDKAKGSVEGDFGSGFYFTDNESDVEEHYEGGGPDFENKVIRRAEQLVNEDDLDWDEAEERAREELFKGSYKHEVYLNIEKPAIVGETNLLESESYFDEYNREDYEDEEDYYAEVEQLVADDIDNIIWEIERNVDVDRTDGIAEVLWEAFNDGGIGIEQLKKKLNNLYLEDSEGNYVANEVARQIIESLGYDGIIDPTVSGKWNMEMEEGTTHYIVFKPNQIKSVTNENPTDDPDVRRSLSKEDAAPYKYGDPTFRGNNVALVNDIAPTTESVTLTQDEAFVAPVAEPFESKIDNLKAQKGRIFNSAWELEKKNDRTEAETLELQRLNTRMHEIAQEISDTLDEKFPEAIYNMRDAENGWGNVYLDGAMEAIGVSLRKVNGDLYATIMQEVDNSTAENSHTPMLNAMIAVGEDVRQETITPMQGAQLLNEVYNYGGVNALKRIYNTATGNLYNQSLERAKKFETIAPTQKKVSAEDVAPLPTYNEPAADPTVFDLEQEKKALEGKIKDAMQAEDWDTYNQLAEEYQALEERIGQMEADEAAFNSERLATLDDVDAPVEQETEYYSLPDTTPLTKKAVVDISRSVRDELGLSKRQMAEVRALIEEYSASEFPSREELYAKIEERFGVQTEQEAQGVEDVQAFLRNSKIKVSDTIKGDIADYNSLRKSLFRKIGFGNDGIDVDSAYHELTDLYPEFFPEDIVNPTDQFLRMAEVAKMAKTVEREYELDSDTIMETADIIINEVSSFRENHRRMAAEREAKRIPSFAPVEDGDIAPISEAYEAIKPRRKAKQNSEPRMIRVDSNNGRPGEKRRKWVKTSTESEAVDGKVLPEDLNQDTIHYQPISNKTTLGKANARLDGMGYESSVDYFNNQFANKRISLEDVALGERLIQEAIKKGDTKTAGELIQNVAILGTELGQKVQALSIIKRLTPEGQLRMLQKTIERGKTKGDKAYDGVELTQEMIDKILKTYGKDGAYDQDKLNEAVEDVKQQIADKMKVSKMDKVNAWRYLSMLGNPKTHIRNLVSNVAMRGTVAVKNVIARSIEDIAPIKNRTKTWKFATDAVKSFSQKTAAEMKDVLSDGGKYSEDASIKAKRAIFKNKILNGLYEFNSDLLSKEDWWFSKPAFINSLSEYLTANGIQTEQDIANNPEVIEKAKQYATEQSQIATFRQYSWLANKINDIERRNAFTDIAVGAILPFKKTPINIAKTGLNYSPLGFAKTLTYDISQVKNGKMEASDLVDHLAQNATGTALALIGYMLASAGFISGGGDDDKEGKYDYQLGSQSYSVNIGGKSYSLSWLSPVAMPLFVGANAHEQLVEGKEWNGDVVVETLAQTLDPLSEMSFLSSLNQVLSSYDSGIEKFAGIGETMIQNYATQFVPTMSSQVATVLDDTKRSTAVAGDSDFKFVDETINKLKLKIPGLRETLEPSTDIWGNEIKQTEDVLTRAFETFFSPANKKDNIATEIDAEIKSLYREVGDSRLIPSIPDNYVNYKNEKYKMSASEYTEFKKEYGQTAYDMLEDMFDNSSYENASKEDKTDWVKKVYDYARDEALRKFLAEKGVKYTNATLKGEEYYKENAIKGAIKNNMPPDEYSFMTDNPEKYAFFKENGISYDDYASADEDGKRAYTWAAENPEYSVALSKAIAGDIIKYRQYASALYDIKADKDEDGKSINGSRKEKVIEWINSLDADYGEKIILFKSEYNADDTYNYEIIDYLNSRDDISYEETEAILKELGFTVKADGTVTW